MKTFVKKYWLTAVILIGMVVWYWSVSGGTESSNYLFPTIEEIWQTFLNDKERFLINLVSSIKLLTPSLLIALVLSLAIGVPVGLSKFLRDALYPILYMVSVIPSILLSPFALMLAPDFRTASIFLIVYGCMFPTVFAVITGIQTIDKRYLDNAATLELKGFERLIQVILPAASPAIFAGLVTTLRGSFLLLVYAEMYGAKYGMGTYVQKYSTFAMYQNVWSGFIFMVIVLVLIMQIFEIIKARVLKWSID